jgi:membrane protein insertase Oxa1/YidC/SpoIIIJ
MSYSFRAALVIYWIIGNLYQIGQTLLVRKIDRDLLAKKNEKLALENHNNKG